MATTSRIPGIPLLNRERMSGIDTAWLRMEHPTNLMMIVGIMVFKEKLDFRKLQTTLEQRFLSYPRFSQKAVQDPTGAWWEDDKKFDIQNHVKKAKLPGRAGKKELQEYVSQMASAGLDFTKPLWQFHLIENYQGGSALLTRIHHCYADGIALISVMLSMTADSADASLAKPKPKEKNGKGKHAGEDMDFWTSVTKPVASVWSGAMKLTRGLVEQGLEIAKDPSTMREFATKGIELAEELRKIAVMEPDSPTRFKGMLGAASVWHGAIPSRWEKSRSLAKPCAARSTMWCSPPQQAPCATIWCAEVTRQRALNCGQWSPSICARSKRPVTLATSSGWYSWICPSGLKIRSSACSRCANG